MELQILHLGEKMNKKRTAVGGPAHSPMGHITKRKETQNRTKRTNNTAAL
jgi:hypothetical protein